MRPEQKLHKLESLRLTTLEHAAAPTGLHTWACARLLCDWLLQNKSLLHNARVLELGCGTALPSFVACCCGAVVTATDADEDALSSAAAASKLNMLESTFRTQRLVWGEDIAATDALRVPQELLIGSDVFYDTSLFDALLFTVAALLRRGHATSRFATVYEHRSRHASLQWRLQRFGLVCISSETVTGSRRGIEGCGGTFEVAVIALDPSS